MQINIHNFVVFPIHNMLDTTPDLASFPGMLYERRGLLRTILAYKVQFTLALCCVAISIFALTEYVRERELQIPKQKSVPAPVGVAIAARLLRNGDISGEVKASDATSTLEAKYQAAISNNDARAIYKLAREYEVGSPSMPRNLARAEALFNEAAKMGDAEAMFRSGYYAEHGINGTPDATSAKNLYEDASESGYADAFAALGKMYIEGRSVIPDQQLADEYISKGIAAGSSEALFLRAVSMLDLSPDKTEAVALLRRAAEADNTNAQQMIARLYREGLILPRDEAKAIEWARLAAANGGSGAQVDLANLLLGLGNKKSENVDTWAEEAVSNLRAAELQRSARASLELAKISMSEAPRDAGDILATQRHATQAFAGGERQAAFGVAMTYSALNRNGEAEEWLAKGAAAGDWRSRYARQLVQNTGMSIREALGRAAKASYVDFARDYAETAPKSRDGVSPPAPVSFTMPRFPVGLEALSTNGRVEAEFVVNEKGVPTSIQIVDSTHPQLVGATVAAISQWRYKPAMRNGVPVPQRMRVPIKFQSTR